MSLTTYTACRQRHSVHVIERENDTRQLTANSLCGKGYTLVVLAVSFSIRHKQANVLTPSMFIAQLPQMPSRQERRKVSVGSISFLILICMVFTISILSLSTMWWSRTTPKLALDVRRIREENSGRGGVGHGSGRFQTERSNQFGEEDDGTYQGIQHHWSTLREINLVRLECRFLGGCVWILFGLSVRMDQS